MATEDLQVFPFEPDATTKSTFRVIERGDLQSEEDIQGLLQLPFLESECPIYYIYYYSEKGLAIDDALRAARDRGDVLMRKTELRHYRHPNFKRDYIRILVKDANYEWDWEKEVVEKGPEFVRTELELCARKHTELEAWQKVQLEEFFRHQVQKEKYQYDVFLSYSDRDREGAETLFVAITQAGGRAFMAPKILSPSDEFAEEIRAALEGAREVWLLVSPNSIGSEWVISE